MNILVLGGTRFMGKHLVKHLLTGGDEVTIATRGETPDTFKDTVRRIRVDRTDREAMRRTFEYRYYDVVYDDLAFCSGHVRTALDTIRCRRYIMVSSASVYPLHFQTVETDYEPEKDRLVWYEDTKEASFDALKKSAECALVHAYPGQNAVYVRFPYVIGADDYTRRLFFYVQHVCEEKAMYIDNMDSQMSFISSDDAGRLLAYLGRDELTGAVNGASRGTVSVREILNYIEKKTGKKAVLQKGGVAAPYNGTPGYSINAEKAERTGFSFSALNDWLFDLLDWYIETAVKEEI